MNKNQKLASAAAVIVLASTTRSKRLNPISFASTGAAPAGRPASSSAVFSMI